MPVSQFDGWRRFFNRYPFDPEGLHMFPAATISSHVANYSGNRKGEAMSPYDLLPSKRPRSENQKDLDQKARETFARVPRKKK